MLLILRYLLVQHGVLIHWGARVEFREARRLSDRVEAILVPLQLQAMGVLEHGLEEVEGTVEQVEERWMAVWRVLLTERRQPRRRIKLVPVARAEKMPMGVLEVVI